MRKVLCLLALVALCAAVASAQVPNCAFGNLLSTYLGTSCVANGITYSWYGSGALQAFNQTSAVNYPGGSANLPDQNDIYVHLSGTGYGLVFQTDLITGWNLYYIENGSTSMGVVLQYEMSGAGLAGLNQVGLGYQYPDVIAGGTSSFTKNLYSISGVDTLAFQYAFSGGLNPTLFPVGAYNPSVFLGTNRLLVSDVITASALNPSDAVSFFGFSNAFSAAGSVPEPGTLMLMAGGLLGLGLLRRRTGL